ncbi:pitrilysin family protein [Amaricoccus sp.]|uniref:M16 family metallopeptidase n=1 Tax=Amaricoccus sp. TaxID=1872485 RepID=UPI001B444182|nr:pitrilysin family protein [Amaricoccus sp.]MBP7001482.1 insulinase family protein [Amaricoccus sp.]
MTAHLHTLPNGLRVVAEPMPGFLSASVGVYVTAGGRHERPEQNGVAHFLEHMAFKGTPTRTARQIAEEIEDVGAYINAYTGKEMTAYFSRTLAADVERGLDILADILLHPLFDAPDIEVERGVILQEIGMSLDTPDDVIFDWLQEVAYPEQPFGRGILGAPERVSAFGRDDLAGFVAERYGPDQLIVAAAGAVDPDALLAAVERRFGHLAARPPVEVAPARFAAGERRVVRKLEQAHVALAFEAPSNRDPAVYASQIYAIALGGGMSSRLFQEIREKRGLCYAVGAHAAAFEDTGLLTIYAGTGGDQLRELEEVAIDELRRAAGGFAPEEVERARAQMTAGLVMNLESPSGRAERLARTVAVWGRPIPVEETLARIAAVTGADVRAFAETLVARAAPAVALLGPVRKAPSQAALARRMAA